MIKYVGAIVVLSVLGSCKKGAFSLGDDLTLEQVMEQPCPEGAKLFGDPPPIGWKVWCGKGSQGQLRHGKYIDFAQPRGQVEEIAYYVEGKIDGVNIEYRTAGNKGFCDNFKGDQPHRIRHFKLGKHHGIEIDWQYCDCGKGINKRWPYVTETWDDDEVVRRERDDGKKIQIETFQKGGKLIKKEEVPAPPNPCN